MVDQGDETMTDRERDLLRAVLSGSALRQIAGARGQTDGDLRVELRRLLARLCTNRQPVAAKSRLP
jgi:DNA-binding NarL/FixJ family response regulator